LASTPHKKMVSNGLATGEASFKKDDASIKKYMNIQIINKQTNKHVKCDKTSQNDAFLISYVK